MKTGKDYIVFPLDLPTAEEALKYVNILKDSVGLFKVGLELFISAGPDIMKRIREITGAGIFLDLKLHDIPATMQRAFLAASRHKPRFITVHCDEGGEFLRQVAEDNPGRTRILAVTVLTSLNGEKLKALGHDERYWGGIPALVLLKAHLAKEAGCHGVVCSGQEVAMVREEFGDELITMVPGIRPAWTLVEGDDQKRVVTPALAVKRGADYIVVGRPIRDADDPADAAARVAEEIEEIL
jgi:orotidine-5'-phosphate decarboxylase